MGTSERSRTCTGDIVDVESGDRVPVIVEFFLRIALRCVLIPI